MLNRKEWQILSIKTFVHFKCNIRMNLDFHVRITDLNYWIKHPFEFSDPILKPEYL